MVAKRPDGTLVTHKLLSENPEQYRDAAVAGIRQLLGVPAGEDVPVEALGAVKMGTTVATNALLERKGERTALVVTRGFRDALRIAYQNRPRLFDRHIVLPELLYSQVIEADERIGAHGDVVTALDEAAARRDLQRAYDAGYRAVAIVLMHGYRYRQHEAALERIAVEIGFPQVSVSHKVSPLMKFVARGDTTVVDAYLSPILRRYVEQVAGDLPDTRLLFMQSSGGLTDARRFQGKDSILSGPAGGIVGMVRTSLAAGFDRVIGFDMGGTSTDVSHFAGRDVSDCERAFETQVAGVRMRAPMMSIHTVAAGGGSILHFDGARLRVGPDSAGANPGPACYRRGGPLAVTDCNVMVGKIQPAFFPHVFGPRATRRSTPTWCARASRSSPRGSAPRPDATCRRNRWPRATSTSPSATWPRRSSASRCSAATTSPRYTLVRVRRRRRPARVPGRRRARHDADLRASAGRRAVRLRHGPRRPDRDARGIGRAPARGRRDGRARRHARPARRRRRPGSAVARRCRRTASAWCGARTCATKAPTRR